MAVARVAGANAVEVERRVVEAAVTTEDVILAAVGLLDFVHVRHREAAHSKVVCSVVASRELLEPDAIVPPRVAVGHFQPTMHYAPVVEDCNVSLARDVGDALVLTAR